MPHLLFVAADEVNAEINGQPDQHGREGDGENVEAADGQRGEPKGVAQADDQAEGGFERGGSNWR